MFQDLVKFLNEYPIKDYKANINCNCSYENCICNVLNSSSSKEIINSIDNVLIDETSKNTDVLIDELLNNKRDKLIKIVTTINTFIKHKR